MTLDYRTAFDLAPIGLVLSKDRLMQSCNLQVLAMFGATRPEQLDRPAASSCSTRRTTSSSAPARASSPAWISAASMPTNAS